MNLEGTFFLKHQAKTDVILSLQKEVNYSSFFETGTFKGKMLSSLEKHFTYLYSIELSKKFFEETRIKFVNSPSVSLFLGDTTRVLPLILKRLKTPVFFWLDAHYWPNSPFAIGDQMCPIREELSCISKHELVESHIILIDDFRCFLGKYDYPTQDELLQLIHTLFPKHRVIVKDDIVRIIPLFIYKQESFNFL